MKLRAQISGSTKSGTVLILAKMQLNLKDYTFMKKSYKELKYRYPRDYILWVVRAQTKEDRMKLRKLKRERAMKMIGQIGLEIVFESLEGVDFISY